MNKQKLLNILQCFFMATIACIAIIFVIKYTFEIKLLDNVDEKNTTTIHEVNTTITAEENTSESIEVSGIPNISDIPVEQRTYTVNEKTYTNKDLLKPCEYYNSSIIYNNPEYLEIAYPDLIIEYMVKQSSCESVDEYVDSLHTNYQSLFNNFFIKNTLIDTKILDDDELNDMNSFFTHIFNTEIDVEYAVLMKTICSIQYYNPNSLDPMETDNETEYFVSYYYNDNWYIDYLYTDYYFFN
ncbi:MAG: hypothetical protein K2M73_07280 [Lachnospiraceae bacterium]|nr:hypothetical protein [Lachnospiraceae bacterium]